MFNIFIGAVLGTIAFYVSIDWAIIIGVLLLILNPRLKTKIINQGNPQQALTDKIAAQQVEKYSDEILGTYLDNPIHAYIVVKNPANGVCYKHDYFDIIHFNGRGQIIIPPEAGDVYLSTGLIYKDTGVVVPN